jgi:R3H domain
LDIDATGSFFEPENTKGGYQTRTLEFFNNYKTWCLEIETIFRQFLSGTTMRYAFKPMTAQKREFLHELADVYGLDSESIDPEPFRRYLSPDFEANEALRSIEVIGRLFRDTHYLRP